jgi:hypothetical protein
VKQTRVLDLEL